MSFATTEATAAELDDVKKLVSDARGLFVRLLEMSLNHSQTKGSCLYAVILCSTLINKFTKHKARIRGGNGVSDGGLFIGQVGHGHYWVELDMHGTPYIIDITADQFGLSPIIIADSLSLPARYEPGNQATVDSHVEGEMSAMKSELC
ncbi:hypothetical protein [Pseudomonas sp. PLMAX]|uniref:hypothetical protein n=1 Tax=Pseudomonas sp. PLMAX TaxID=2201998 RepID=UPI0038BD53FE